VKRTHRSWPKAGVGMALVAGLAATGGGVAWAATSHPASASPALARPGVRPPGPLGHRRHRFALVARLVSIGSGSITVAGPLGAERTIATTSSTRYLERGASIPTTDFSAGDRVGIRLEKVSGSSTVSAKAVVLLESAIRGRIESVGSGSSPTLTVREPSGIWVTVDTSSTTVVRQGKATSSLSSLAQGERVVVVGMASSDHQAFDASAIRILPTVVRGKVLSVSGSTIDIVAPGGFDETVQTSSSTTFRQGPSTASLSSVTAGEHIWASGTKAGTGVLDASVVRIAPPRPPAPAPAGSVPPAPPAPPAGNNP